VHVVAYVSIDGFYLGALGKAPSFSVVHHDKRVIDADPAARARGVQVGMPLSEAKAILAGDGQYVEWQEEDFRDAQRSWINAATDITDALEPDGQHAAYLDLSGHPRPSDVARALVKSLESNGGFRVSLGLANSRWVARQAALLGDRSEAALHVPKRFVARLPTFALPLPEEILSRLALLGYGKVGDIAHLPFESLRRQFGEFAFDIRRMALGGGTAEVQAVFPKDCLSERFCFDGSPETIQGLELGLTAIANRLGNRLRHEDATAKSVELFWEGEDGSVDVRRRTFSKAISGAALLLPSLRLMLSVLPPNPIAAVRVRLPDIRRSKRVQLGLAGEHSRLDRERSVEAAVINARTAFGDLAVIRGADVVNPRFKEVRRAYTAANGWVWN